MAVLAGSERPAVVNSLNSKLFLGTAVAGSLRDVCRARQAGGEGGHGYFRRNDDGRVRPAGAVLCAREHLRATSRTRRRPASSGSTRASSTSSRNCPHRHEFAGSVTAFSRLTNTIQGDLQSTGIPTHMALNGEGYFIVQERSGYGEQPADLRRRRPLHAARRLRARQGRLPRQRRRLLPQGLLDRPRDRAR